MPTVGSRYLPRGLSLFTKDATDDLWRNAPDPRLILPANGVGYFDDFASFRPDEWTATAVSVGTGTSTLAHTSRSGGAIRINCAANENDGINAQLVGEAFSLASGTELWFEARVDITEEVTQSDAIVGLCILDTDLVGGMTDGIYFHKDDGDTNWDFACEKDSTATEVAAIATAVVDTWIRLGFHYSATTGIATPYVNGVAGTTVSTNIPDNELLSVSIAYLNGAGTAQNDGMDIDYIRVVNTFDRS